MDMKHATTKETLSNPKLSQLKHPVFDFRIATLNELQKAYARLGRQEDMAYTKIVGVFSTEGQFNNFVSSNPEWESRFVCLIYVKLTDPEILKPLVVII